MTGILEADSKGASLASLFGAFKSAALRRDPSANDLLEQLHDLATGPAARSLLLFLKAQYLDLDSDRLWLSQLAARKPEPGLSLVSFSMDRTENLLKSLESWVELDVDEIVIVDWSSRQEVFRQLGDFPDPRIKVVRIEGEPYWIATSAFNVGLQLASREKVYKLDADVRVSKTFLEVNQFGAGEFVRGNWSVGSMERSSDQKYVNGSCGAFKNDFHRAGYYNEYIRKYGWDDTDLYLRLAESLGLKAKFFDNASLEHLPQDEEQRLLNQNANRQLFLGMYDATEYYNMLNKNLCMVLPEWDPRLLDEYSLKQVDERYFVGERVSTPVPVPEWAAQQAACQGVIELLSWDRKSICGQAIAEPRLAKLLAETFEAGQGHIGARLVAHPDTSEGVALFESGRFNLPALLEFQKDTGTDCLLVEAGEEYSALSIVNGGRELAILQAGSSLLASMEDAFTIDCCNPSAEYDHAQVLSDAAPVLAISLYDESNPTRLDEYLFCLENNLDWFSWVVVFYEESTGEAYRLIKERLEGMPAYDKLIFTGIEARPTFSSIFRFMDTYFHGAAVVVANADIAFDASIGEVQSKLDDDVFMVLSRREVDGKNLDVNSPIINSLGVPNTHSADAWIYRAPLKFQFRADFGVGTFHCDSFLNNYIGKSGYKLFNPCISVNAFHVHNPEFNSSVTKNIEQQEQISEALAREIEINDGAFPIKGVEWSTLNALGSVKSERSLVDWKDMLFRVEVDADLRNLYPSLLCMLAAWSLAGENSEYAEVWLMLKQPFASNASEDLLDRLRKEINLPRLRFGICNAEESSLTEALSDRHRFHRVFGPDLTRASIDEKGVHIPEKETGQDIDLWAGINNGIVITVDTEMSDMEMYGLVEHVRDEHLDRLQRCLSAVERAGWPSTRSWLDELTAASSMWQKSSPKAPTVAFVTSIYNGDKYMSGYLQNISAAASMLNSKVICVDANSPGNERSIFDEFIASNPQLAELFEYISLDEDPGLYECWRLAIESSGAEFITNANLDDRRSPLHTVSLVNFLVENPQYAAAATAIRPVSDPTIGWYDAAASENWFRYDFSEKITFDCLYRRDEEGNVLSQDMLHCMPVWRSELHEKYGYFDEKKYGTSADWAFWLKCSSAGETFGLLPLVLTQYLVNPDSHNRQNDIEGEKELGIIREYIGADQTKFIPQ